VVALSRVFANRIAISSFWPVRSLVHKPGTFFILLLSVEQNLYQELAIGRTKENIRKLIAIIPSEYLPPLGGIFMFMGSTFSTLKMIYEQ
jgi:hypothetical protein